MTPRSWPSWPGGEDRTLILWDVSDRARPRNLGKLGGHDAVVRSVAFSPDGHTLATGSNDRTVILWDLSNRAQPRRLGQPLAGHREQVSSVAFAPDGCTLASGSWDGTVQLWDLSQLNKLRQHPAETACSLAGRGLNRDEWTRQISQLPYEDTCPHLP